MTSITTLCTTFSAEMAVRRAVVALRATGVAARDLQLLSGRPLGDVRQARDQLEQLPPRRLTGRIVRAARPSTAYHGRSGA